MKIYSPNISGSATTTGSLDVIGNFTVTGSLNITGSVGLASYGANPPTGTPDKVGLFYFTDTALYISLD